MRLPRGYHRRTVSAEGSVDTRTSRSGPRWTLRVVFGHPLRQTEGFLDSLLSLMSRDLKAPDHTTLSRRNQIVVVPPLTRAHGGPIDLIVDSTGLKILGRGEWNAHKTSKKRRDRGTDQIAVKIQHKDRLLTDPGAIEDILAVEDDVVPFDRADVLEQGGVDAFFCDSPRAHRLRDLLGLPIDDASQNQRQAATGVHLLV